MKKETTLLFGGDFVIREGFTEDDIQISTDLIKEFEQSDFNALNLECPVTDATSKDRIRKTGPHLKGNKQLIKKKLKELDIDLLTLANNHILDYGSKGVLDTLDFCEGNDFYSVGAGKNLFEARKSFRTTVDSKKISIINFAENEWSSAKDNSPGGNPYDLIDNLNQIKEEKNLADIVIVVIHGGHEYYNLPSPRMVKEYRFYADGGADLIVGHHPHCISGFEIYKNTPIYYSLGNFLFTSPSSYSDWYLGMILKIRIKNDNSLQCELLPIKQDKSNYSIGLLEDVEYESVIANVLKYSKIINNGDLLKKEWDLYVSKKLDTYLSMFSVFNYIRNKYVKIILYKLKITKLFLNKRVLTLYLNLLRCESHLDMSKASILKLLGDEDRNSEK